MHPVNMSVKPSMAWFWTKQELVKKKYLYLFLIFVRQPV